MMKRLVFPALALMLLAACGKGADNYVGYWQKDGNMPTVLEIRKEGGNYFATEILKEGAQSELLTEKDGQLMFNILGDVPIRLSDDGNSLYFEKESYRRIDDAAKDKLVAHEEACRKLYAERKDSAGKPELRKQIVARLDELEKEGRCLRGVDLRF